MKPILLGIMILVLINTTISFAKSVDQCTQSFLLCQESCQRYHDQCTSKGNESSYCSGQYTQCENGCQNALNRCNS